VPATGRLPHVRGARNPQHRARPEPREHAPGGGRDRFTTNAKSARHPTPAPVSKSIQHGRRRPRDSSLRTPRRGKQDPPPGTARPETARKAPPAAERRIGEESLRRRRRRGVQARAHEARARASEMNGVIVPSLFQWDGMVERRPFSEHQAAHVPPPEHRLPERGRGAWPAGVAGCAGGRRRCVGAAVASGAHPTRRCSRAILR